MVDTEFNSKPENQKLTASKESITIRLDRDIMEYFRSLSGDVGLPYQTIINLVLKEYVKKGYSPSANWD